MRGQMPPKPELDCDLVMAGGITSGIVFPKAVMKLKEKYRFRSIGGTSAGAIAAAIVAAAEYGRRQGNAQSFDAVAGMPGFFASNLAGLFQPAAGFGSLFRLAKLLINLRAKPQDGFWRQIWSAVSLAVTMLWGAMPLYPLFAAAGLFFGAIVFVPFLSMLLGPDIWLPLRFVMGFAAPFALVMLFLFSIAAAIAFGVIRDILKLKDNDYGICPGLSQSGNGPGLTDWLDATIEAAAGKSSHAGEAAPLTFADLEGSDESASIGLKMMTTNITFGVGQVLPGLGGTPYYFDEDEMLKVLPKRVVDYMKSLDTRQTMKKPDQKSIYRFPSGPQLPVIAAVRMSLNFPFLFTAFPLYSIIRAPKAKSDEAPHRLERVLFSDGGITSNFPIRFFDSLLPTRPTFGISLDDMPEPKHNEVYLPMSAGSGLQYQPRVITGLVSYVFAIINTAREWQDRKQGRISGYRERIAHIYLNKGEGGLNLDMPGQVIGTLSTYGERAGRLMAGTSPLTPSKARDVENFDFPDHQWRRFLIAYAQIEEMLETMHGNWTGAGGKPSVKSAIETLKNKPPSYAQSSQIWRDAVFARTQALMKFFEDTYLAAPGMLRESGASDIPKHSAKLQIVPDD